LLLTPAQRQELEQALNSSGIRPYGPGKFGTIVDSYVYELSLNGPDDECGDVDDAPAEPHEDDITTDDHSRFYQPGRVVMTYHEDGTANYLPDNTPHWRMLGTFKSCEAALRAYMDATQYWPNCWFISDHGNAHLVDLSEGK
jgi:hypothetical protein